MIEWLKSFTALFARERGSAVGNIRIVSIASSTFPGKPFPYFFSKFGCIRTLRLHGREAALVR